MCQAGDNDVRVLLRHGTNYPRLRIVIEFRIMIYMIKYTRLILVLMLVGMLGWVSSSAVQAQDSDSVYIPETGHWLWGEFLRTYNSAPDPLLYFGYPITDDFIDPITKSHVQYFEKARFDLVETPEGPKVQIAPLGQLLHEEGNPLADIPGEGPTCRLFKSGYSVCYAFLQYYDAFLGETYFGMPLSEVEVVDGRYVQYFDHARMEWWPDRPSGQRVVLTELGRVYFDKVVANPDLLKPSPPATSAGNLLNPQVKVFTLKSRIGVSESQTVFVIVQDQYTRAIEGAQVGVTLGFPDNTREFYRLPETNEFGISQFTFTTPDLPVRSVVNILAEISIRGEHGSGLSWFRIWW